MFSIFLALISILRYTINVILLKFYSLTKVWGLSIYIVSVISSVPNYLNYTEIPIIGYKYSKPIRSTIFDFNKVVTDINIDSNSPDS